MVQIDVTIKAGSGVRRCTGRARRPLVTDAPVDNHGKGESFSPTDLVATALGACIRHRSWGSSRSGRRST
ncbi:MAG: hypothetical protein MZV49_00240 [Rhodopseudomonas palustris]|nr:hypothetical protein [Rhodopseudomonas palustris]